MGVWDAMAVLDGLVDESDPDLSLPQSIHAFQTAEAIREALMPGPAAIRTPSGAKS